MPMVGTGDFGPKGNRFDLKILTLPAKWEEKHNTLEPVFTLAALAGGILVHTF